MRNAYVQVWCHVEKRRTRVRGGGVDGEYGQGVKRGVKIKKVLTVTYVVEPLNAAREMWKCDGVKNAV